MNMILHDFPTANVLQGNTLAEPQVQGRRAAPHLRLRGGQSTILRQDLEQLASRPAPIPISVLLGVRRPAKQGDYAYLLHIIRSMKSNGKAACILPHGVLYSEAMPKP